MIEDNGDPYNPASGTERALIARGLNGTEIVLATDGPWLASDVEQIGDNNCDLVICLLPDRPGLYLFTGVAKTSVRGPGYEPRSDWQGSVRPVQPEELAELLAMEPPEPESQQGRYRCLACGVVVQMEDGDEFPQSDEKCSHEFEKVADDD